MTKIIDDNEVEVPAVDATPVGTPGMITVVAPSDLEAGYTFTATAGAGQDFLVTVPEGGVKAGQKFEVPQPTAGDMVVSGGSPAAKDNKGDGPMGSWRKGLCSCCDLFCCGNGCLFWQAFCCQGFLMGQLLERMHLDWCGSPTSDWSSTCNTVTAIMVAYIIAECAGVGFAVAPVVLIWSLIAMTRLRHTMRKRYEIDPSCTSSCDGKMDDCCCAFWCGCCVSMQMARHTHDEKVHPYGCCLNKGLPESAPECV